MEKVVKISKILTIVFGVVTVGAAIMFLVTFSDYSHYKNGREQLVSDYVKEVESQATSDDELLFAWARKGMDLRDEGVISALEYAHFTAPEKFASIEFDYPATWSAYEKNNMSPSTRSDRYDVYFDEKTVTPTGDGTSHALHVSIEPTLYERVLAQYQGNVDDGRLKASPYIVTGAGHDTDDYTGVWLEGVLEQGTSGVAVILKTREKTMIIRCDIEAYIEDFERIVLPSFKFIP